MHPAPQALSNRKVSIRELCSKLETPSTTAVAPTESCSQISSQTESSHQTSSTSTAGGSSIAHQRSEAVDVRRRQAEATIRQRCLRLGVGIQFETAEERLESALNGCTMESMTEEEWMEIQELAICAIEEEEREMAAALARVAKSEADQRAKDLELDKQAQAAPAPTYVEESVTRQAVENQVSLPADAVYSNEPPPYDEVGMPDVRQIGLDIAPRTKRALSYSSATSHLQEEGKRHKVSDCSTSQTDATMPLLRNTVDEVESEASERDETRDGEENTGRGGFVIVLSAISIRSPAREADNALDEDNSVMIDDQPIRTARSRSITASTATLDGEHEIIVERERAAGSEADGVEEDDEFEGLYD